MGLQARGGIPRIHRITVTSAGVGADPFLFDQVSLWVRIKPIGDALELYSTEADFDADANYILIGDGTVFEAPIEDRGLYMKASASSATVEVLVCHRKG